MIAALKEMALLVVVLVVYVSVVAVLFHPTCNDKNIPEEKRVELCR
jgi:hypothetical protein